jgi:C1A family cysteine protease
MLGIFKNAEFPMTGEVFATGWLPPFPDMRDYTEATPVVAKMAKKLNVLGKATIGASITLCEGFSPVEDQGQLGSCSANATAGIVEYMELRAFGKYIDASRLFIYKTTRDLMRVTGDTGAWLRFCLGALVLCGAPPEKYWPYNIADFDKEPPAFVYSVADNYEALNYFCHDPIGANKTGAQVLDSVKKYIAAGIPSVFGFYGFPSANQTNVKGAFPFPCPGEQAAWGHAIVACGYDDDLVITNTKCNKSTKGALRIRNSWGPAWGDKGYGWLPYDYVINKLALDFWSLLSMEWVDTGKFGL